MTYASSIFDGRTRYGRTARQVPTLDVLSRQLEQRPAAAFEAGQMIATPEGKLKVARRHFGNVKDTNQQDWHYVFQIRDVVYPGLRDAVYTETVLLPLQIAAAAVPPAIPPMMAKLTDSPAGENHDAWAENLCAWVASRLGE